jgi:solute carrier family 39 (zinc transporter), member 1/2/3
MFLLAKSGAAIILLLITSAAGILPILQGDKETSRLMNLSNACARGIFLSAGFVHFLPDALRSQTNPTLGNTLTLFALTAITILFFEYGEQCSWRAAKRCQHHSCLPLYALLGMLGIHSFIEGTGLGIQSNISDLVMVFSAILAHKVAVAFSLAMQMMHHHIKTKRSILFIALFASITPIAILSSTWFFLTYQPWIQSNDIISCIDAICAGTFMYIGLVHHETTDSIETPDERKNPPSLNLCATLVGFICMTMLAYFG